MRFILFINFLFFNFSCFANVVRVDQGWSRSTREKVYQAYEGAQLMPLEWFLALEQDNSHKPFTKILVKYGVLDGEEKSQNKETNPFSLPIGFTTTKDTRTASLYGSANWVGVNCAACHTSMLSINNKKVIIEGGTNMFDFDLIQTDLLKAVSATLKDKTKFSRFTKKVTALKGSDKKLREYLEKFQGDFSTYLDRNKYVGHGKKRIRLGPERMDGIGIPNNESACYLTELGDLELREKLIDKNICRNFPSFTGVPYIWGTNNEDYTHYAGIIHSSFGRNIGQAAGVLAKLWVEKEDNKPIFKSTANFKGLQNLEKWYRQLTAPEWEDLQAQDVVKALDQDLIARGRKLYKSKKCLSCHSLQPELTQRNIPVIGREFWRINVTPLDEIGTDPARVRADLDKKMQLPSIMKKRYEQTWGVLERGQNEVTVFKYRSLIVKELLESMTAGMSKMDKLKASSCRVPDRSQSIVGYKARSLEGVFFTAPFLHNSSIPTLNDLFKPSSLRPKEFYIGCRNYDLELGGYNCKSVDKNSFLVDTNLPGGSNEGHEYGTDMSALERKSMIEFLKSLKNPKAPKLGLCH